MFYPQGRKKKQGGGAGRGQPKKWGSMARWFSGDLWLVQQPDT